MPARSKSKAAKELAGTDRPRKRVPATSPGRLEVAPEPPASLSARAAQEWRELAPVCVWLGTLSGSDTRALALLATTLAREAEAREVIDEEGFTINTGDGGRKAHPALKALEVATTQATRLLAEFGMTPRARGGIDTAPLGRPVQPSGEGTHPMDAIPLHQETDEDGRWDRLRKLRLQGGKDAA